MLAHCQGKQARDQEVAWDLTTPMSPQVYGNKHAPGLIGYQGVLSSVTL